MFKPWAVDGDRWGVEITQGPFEGAVIQIENVELSPKEDGSVEVDYHLLSIPAHLNESEFKNENFNSTMQEIINEILREAVTYYESNRNNDTSQSD